MTAIGNRYDAEADAAYMRLSESRIIESSEVLPNLVLDDDEDGHILGIEMLDARNQLAAALLKDVA